MSVVEDRPLETLIVELSPARALRTLLAQHAPDREVVERLKRRVDHEIRVNPRRALALALRVRLAGEAADDPYCRALGVRAVAQAHHLLHHYGAARALYEQAVQFHDQLGQTAEACRVRRNLVDVLMYESRYADALRIAEEARLALEPLNDARLSAELEINVGNVFHRLDRMHDALAHYQRAAELLERADAPPRLRALCAFNQANIYSKINELDRAEELYRQARDAYARDGLDFLEAQTAYSLAYLEFLAGEFDRAIEGLEDARRTFRAAGNVRERTLCDLDLAEIYLHLGHDNLAADCAGRAAEGFERIDAGYEASRANFFLGQALLRHGRSEAAADALVRACKGFARENNAPQLGLVEALLCETAMRNAGGSLAGPPLPHARAAFRLLRRSRQPRLQSLGALTLARALLHENHDGRAARVAQIAAARSRQCGDREGTAEAHQLLARAARRQNRPGDALKHLQQAVEQIEQSWSRVSGDDVRVAYADRHLAVYDELAAAHVERGDYEQAFRAVEMRRARVMADRIVGRPLLRAGLRRDSQWEQLRRELDREYLRRKTARADLAASANDDRVAELERQLADLRRQSEIQNHRRFVLAGRGDPQLSDVLAALRPAEALVEYAEIAGRLFVFCLTAPDGLRCVELPEPGSRFAPLLHRLHFLLEQGAYGARLSAAARQRTERALQELLSKLHGWLIAPLENLLETRALMVVPTGLLHGVPFHALRGPHGHLVERHEIAWGPSAQIVTLLRRARPAAGPALILVGPEESSPGILQEARDLAELIPQARLIEGPSATFDALRAGQQSRFVHICAHGRYRPDLPLLSSLRLADGEATFYEISTLDLNCDTIVLSGCETGLNSVTRGDDLLGLVRGCFDAGASNMVVSLWSVDDAAAPDLMKTFYRQRLCGVSPRAAMRAAQLALIHKGERIYSWAPFVLIGGGINLEATP